MRGRGGLEEGERRLPPAACCRVLGVMGGPGAQLKGGEEVFLQKPWWGGWKAGLGTATVSCFVPKSRS